MWLCRIVFNIILRLLRLLRLLRMFRLLRLVIPFTLLNVVLHRLSRLILKDPLYKFLLLTRDRQIRFLQDVLDNS